MCWRPTRRRPSNSANGADPSGEHRRGALRLLPEAKLAHAPAVSQARVESGYFVLVVVALLAAVAAVAGAALPSPLASTALHAAGSCSSISAGLGGVGGPGGAGGRCSRGIQSATSLPQPSSLGGSACASQLLLPLGQAMRI